MKILKFSEHRHGMDKHNTLTIFIDENTVMKISEPDIMGAMAAILDRTSKKDEIPHHVIEAVKNSIPDIEEVKESVEEIKEVEEVEEKPSTGKKERNEPFPRMGKVIKQNLLAYVEKSLDMDAPVLEDAKIEEIIGAVPRERVAAFLMKTGYNLEFHTDTNRIKINSRENVLTQ